MPRTLRPKRAQFKPPKSLRLGARSAAGPLDFGCVSGKGFDRKVFMSCSLNRLFIMACVSALALIATGCQEDVRYSGQTQYLGGVYGTAPTSGAPNDNASY